MSDGWHVWRGHGWYIFSSYTSRRAAYILVTRGSLELSLSSDDGKWTGNHGCEDFILISLGVEIAQQDQDEMQTCSWSNSCNRKDNDLVFHLLNKKESLDHTITPPPSWATIHTISVQCFPVPNAMSKKIRSAEFNGLILIFFLNWRAFPHFIWDVIFFFF